ncbi:MAG: hypothetical protein V1840_05870 [Candidatus Omnitrophota bacterium]
MALRFFRFFIPRGHKTAPFMARTEIGRLGIQILGPREPRASARVGSILIFLFVLVTFLWQRSTVAQVAKTYEEPEAGAWLARPVPAFTPQAEKKERLERLVDWLYKDGAVFVGVVLTEGGEVSGLKVYLPTDQGSREQIVRVVNRENAKSGYRPEDDEGQDTLVIWLNFSS